MGPEPSGKAFQGKEPGQPWDGSDLGRIKRRGIPGQEEVSTRLELETYLVAQDSVAQPHCRVKPPWATHELGQESRVLTRVRSLQVLGGKQDFGLHPLGNKDTPEGALGFL